MPEPTLREWILDRIETRLRAIEAANGFYTDAGRNIQVGETTSLGLDELPVGLAILVDDDEIEYEGEKVAIVLPIDIQILTRVGRIDGWTDIERALGDVKRAMELNTAQHRLSGADDVGVPPLLRRGQTRTLPREDGSIYMGVSIRYLVGPMQEPWGQP